MREISLGQIAYEAHFGETAGDYSLQSEKQQDRWQRSADAVLAEAIARAALKPCPCRERDARIDAAMDGM